MLVHISNNVSIKRQSKVLEDALWDILTTNMLFLFFNITRVRKRLCHSYYYVL